MSTQKLGRPHVDVIWPDGEFSVVDIANNTGLSKVTVYIKIQEARKNGLIEKCGGIKTGKGCPRSVFRKVVQTAA